MAERRMISKTLVTSDRYLDLPQTSQLLYFHLLTQADDDGFVGNPRSVMRLIGAKKEDLQLLIKEGLLLSFDSGIVLIRHWKVHNYIRKDIYVETKYTDEKQQVFLSKHKLYEKISEHPGDTPDNGDAASLHEQDVTPRKPTADLHEQDVTPHKPTANLHEQGVTPRKPTANLHEQGVTPHRQAADLHGQTISSALSTSTQYSIGKVSSVQSSSEKNSSVQCSGSVKDSAGKDSSVQCSGSVQESAEKDSSVQCSGSVKESAEKDSSVQVTDKLTAGKLSKHDDGIDIFNDATNNSLHKQTTNTNYAEQNGYQCTTKTATNTNDDEFSYFSEQNRPAPYYGSGQKSAGKDSSVQCSGSVKDSAEKDSSVQCSGAVQDSAEKDGLIQGSAGSVRVMGQCTSDNQPLYYTNIKAFDEAINKTIVGNRRTDTNRTGHLHDDKPGYQRCQQTADNQHNSVNLLTPVFTIPAKNGRFIITEGLFRDLEQSYPRLEILQKLRKIRQYLESHPQKQRLSTATEQYIRLWLSEDEKKLPPETETTAMFEKNIQNYESHSVIDNDALMREFFQEDYDTYFHAR